MHPILINTKKECKLHTVLNTVQLILSEIFDNVNNMIFLCFIIHIIIYYRAMKVY